MSVFYDLNKTPRNILNQAIVRAIVSENNGAWFDPSDLSTLYQDSAGTIPVTAVEQPVGLMLDKSGNGWHATQSITASRPTLSARYNLLTKTEDFSDAAWVKFYCLVSPNSTLDPFGGMGADTITSYLPTGITFLSQSVSTLIVGATYTASRYVKAGTVSKCTLGMHQLADIYFDLNSLTYNIDGSGAVSASIENIGDGWRKITGSWVWSGTRCEVYFAAAATMSSQIGVPVGGTLHTFGHSLVLGTTAGHYQRVNTDTDYDTDERYFKKYLRFDGVDDYLNLPYMGLYAGGSASVVSAVKVNNAGVPFYLVGEGNTSNNNVRYGLARINNGTQIGAYLRDDTAAFSMNTSNDAPLSLTASMVYSITDNGLEIIPRANSGKKLINPYLRPAQLTTNATAIGAMPAPSFIAFAPHNLYSLIITKSALTDSQRIACERHLSRKAGVIL